jgi:mono/diheme cytochrome c family protein
MVFQTTSRLLIGLFALLASWPGIATEVFTPDPALVERGRYVATVSGCNDCHTAGYASGDGNVPESRWMLGDNFGWSGPWGTTYGTNLRIYIGALTESQWVEAARTMRRRPPMPWFNLNQMAERDLKAFYHFVRSLGDTGSPAPTALPPGQTPEGPRAQWVLR